MPGCCFDGEVVQSWSAGVAQLPSPRWSVREGRVRGLGSCMHTEGQGGRGTSIPNGTRLVAIGCFDHAARSRKLGVQPGAETINRMLNISTPLEYNRHKTAA